MSLSIKITGMHDWLSSVTIKIHIMMDHNRSYEDNNIGVSIKKGILIRMRNN